MLLLSPSARLHHTKFNNQSIVLWKLLPTVTLLGCTSGGSGHKRWFKLP